MHAIVLRTRGYVVDVVTMWNHVGNALLAGV
jgi:hypothetical protein